jgi:hypothetical protein
MVLFMVLLVLRNQGEMEGVVDGHRQQGEKFEASLVTPEADAAATGVGEDEFEAFLAGDG